MKLIDYKVDGFVNETASDSPAPGGGSVSALCGSLGVALSEMVCHLTIGKKKYEENEEQVKEILSKVSVLKDELLVLIDKDTEAFNGVSAVFSMPKETDEEKEARKGAMQNALKEATIVPFSVMEACFKGLQAIENAVSITNTNCASDLGVSALTLKTGVQGAWLNVLINVSGIKDESFVNEYKTKGQNILDESVKLSDKLFDDILKSL